LSINSAAIALLPRQEITYAVAQITSNSTTEFAEENSQDVTSGEPLYSAEQSGTLYWRVETTRRGLLYERLFQQGDDIAYPVLGENPLEWPCRALANRWLAHSCWCPRDSRQQVPMLTT